MRIYQASSLFTAAEVCWHHDFGEKLAGDFFTPQEIDSWGADAPKRIMEKARAAIDDCDVVVALLDGAQVDDGTAWEIGYAHAKGKPVVGIRTDFRNDGDTKHSRINAMIEGSCVGIDNDFDEVLAVIHAFSPHKQCY